MSKMAASVMDVASAKKKLSEMLPGDTMKVYMQLLMSWFKSKITRSDFDHEARKLMSDETVHLHNQFILALLHKCQSLGSSLARETSSGGQKISPTKPPKKRDGRKRPAKEIKAEPQASQQVHGYMHRFIPVNPILSVPQANVIDEKSLAFASREMTLPDSGMVYGRLLVTGWDFGIEGIDDQTVNLVLQAVEVQLKNIITAVLIRQRAYKVREGRFRHAIGTQLPETHTRNSSHAYDFSRDSESTSISSGKGLYIPSMKPSVETGLKDAAVQLACGTDMPPTTHPINLYDLFESLQVHKSVIPSHTVYATSMERIIHKLWHYSNEELEQSAIHRQQATLRRNTLNQQMAIMRP